ncbi:MAG: 3'(2'),5'-bisphosphate nucleotidase CysQ [Deltaproteobacteria bacterium]|nr:3'(2'),5'-bisphosphate nucleotidase CysQ [Deltaproteobacteria bacterium]
MRVEGDAQLEALVELGRRAGARAEELYAEHGRGALEVEEKSPGNPVTRADRELDRMLSEAIRSAYPEAGVVSEESVPTAAALFDELAKDEVFFLDPIDGTREFLERNGEFAVMVGLARGGRASAGVVVVPAHRLLLAGRVGQRAFVEHPDGRRDLLAVTSIERFDEARMLVSRAHRPPLVEPLRRRLGIGRLLPCGSVGVKVSRIVLGQGDLYVHAGRGLSLWDTCAPGAILAAAGGRMTDLDGLPIDYRGPTGLSRGLVASNGALHPGVMSAVAWAEREVARTSPR